MILQNKIIETIKNHRLSLELEGEKYWFNYKLRITKLFWVRNLFDGYQIEVYEKDTNIHLDTIWY